MSIGKRITTKNGVLQVPNFPIIPYIEGDGSGPDIWKAAVRVIDSAVKIKYKDEKRIIWKEIFAGEEAYKLTGSWLPEETIEAFKEHLIGIKGPLTTPVGGGIRSLNVALRQILNLFVCFRPVRWFEGVPSPVCHPELVDMVIFRENTEDVYAGLELAAGTEQVKELITFCKNHFGWDIRKDSGVGLKPISKTGSERLIRAAVNYALNNNRKSVTMVHKGNIQKFTEGAFRNWGYELIEKEFKDRCIPYNSIDGKIPEGKVLIKDVIADNFLQQILTRPAEFDVIATTNLNGDYISDALAAQVGGIGIAPGGNINFESGHAIFEATHGSAPKYTGMDKVNPSSLILSGELMLRYIGWSAAADLIIKGFKKTIQEKIVTYDFARLMKDAKEVKCSEFADKIIDRM